MPKKIPQLWKFPHTERAVIGYFPRGKEEGRLAEGGGRPTKFFSAFGSNTNHRGLKGKKKRKGVCGREEVKRQSHEVKCTRSAALRLARSPRDKKLQPKNIL